MKTKVARMKQELDEKVDMSYLDGEMDIMIDMLSKLKREDGANKTEDD